MDAWFQTAVARLNPTVTTILGSGNDSIVKQPLMAYQHTYARPLRL